MDKHIAPIPRSERTKHNSPLLSDDDDESPSHSVFIRHGIRDKIVFLEISEILRCVRRLCEKVVMRRCIELLSEQTASSDEVCTTNNLRMKDNKKQIERIARTNTELSGISCVLLLAQSCY